MWWLPSYLLLNIITKAELIYLICTLNWLMLTQNLIFLEGCKSAINCSFWSHRHVRPRHWWLVNYGPQSTSPYPPSASCPCSSHISSFTPIHPPLPTESVTDPVGRWNIQWVGETFSDTVYRISLTTGDATGKNIAARPGPQRFRPGPQVQTSNTPVHLDKMSSCMLVSSHTTTKCRGLKISAPPQSQIKLSL